MYSVGVWLKRAGWYAYDMLGIGCSGGFVDQINEFMTIELTLPARVCLAFVHPRSKPESKPPCYPLDAHRNVLKICHT